MIKDNKELDVAISAAKVAGDIIKKNFGMKYRVIRKSPREMVSEIDIQSQQAIMEVLKKHDPSCEIISEEKLFFEKKQGKGWVIDPIDGTHNYIAGLPFSGVSIGLVEDDVFRLGVIYFPMEDELYYTVKGQGAYCNGKQIFVSDNPDLSKAVVHYDNQFHLSEKSFDYYRALTEKAFTTRIFGVATKDLCLIASGVIDGRIWNSTKIVDIAAGAVIVTEAGGQITEFYGNDCNVNSKQVVASNGKIHSQLLEIFQEKNT